MAKLNKKISTKKLIEDHPDKTENYEGGVAFKMDDKARLYTRVASCLVGEPKFYKNINEDGTVDINQDKDLIKDLQLVADKDPEFILKLASYARNELYLRTVSIVLLVEASLISKCKPFVRKYIPSIVKRADELAEAVAYLQRKIGHLGNKEKKGSVPSALKRGLADAFNNFNEYELAKYNRKGFVKLKDVLKLVHPKPKDKEQSAIFKRLKEDKLKTPETWEVEISTKGSAKENWESIYPKMGFMAVLRNLRNFLNKGVSEKTISNISTKLGDSNQVLNSKQLPFRFFSAYRELEGNDSIYTSKILDALESSMDISVDNLPKLKGTTFITADNSGSMDTGLSEKSKVTLKDVSNLMLAISHKMCEFPITSVFGDEHAIVQLSQRNGVLSNLQKVKSEGQKVGCSTNAYLAIKYLIDNKIKADRIILFSDMQCYDTHSYIDSETIAKQLKEYKSKVNSKVCVYSIDLAGYGTMQIPKDEPNVCLIAGWSENILRFIKLFEEDKRIAVGYIEKWQPKEKKEKIEE